MSERVIQARKIRRGPAPSLLRAVDPFKHGSVPEVSGFQDFAVAEAERIGGGCGFSAGGDLGEDDHDIAVGEEAAGRYRQGLLGQLREHIRELGFAAIRSADRAVTGQNKLDVVVVEAQDRFEVALGEGCVPLLGCLDILTWEPFAYSDGGPNSGRTLGELRLLPLDGEVRR